MPLEIELKLRLSPDDVPRLQRNPLLTSLTISRPVTRKLCTTYYDTPDLYLWRNQIAFRLRRLGKKWIQSIKSGGSAAIGLHQRYEWESPVTTAQPDFTRISDSSLANLFDNPALREQLQPVFTTDFKRSIRVLRLADGSETEFSLDQGTIRTPTDASMAICEIELELKSGNPLSLYQFALDMLHTVPFRLENASKAERGYALVYDVKSAPVKAKPIQLTTEMKLSEGFRAITWNCLTHLHGNEAGLLERHDTEYLHQMRVALRRGRSALRIFAKLFLKSIFASVTEELEWLSRRLGPARDWDVFVSETLTDVRNNFSEHAGVRALEGECEQIRQKHYETACEAVESTRYTELMLKLGAWLSAEPWLVPADLRRGGRQKIRLEMPVKEFADNLLSLRHEQLKKYRKKLSKLDTAKLHALRIAVKEQRYVAEFFSELYSKKKVKRYIKSLVVLQEKLGAVNDAIVAERLLNEVSIEEEKSRECEAIGIVLGWTANVALMKKNELDEVWADFEKNPGFW